MAPPSIASLLQPYTPPPLRDDCNFSFNRLTDTISEGDLVQQDSCTRSTVTRSECSDCGDHEASSPSYAWNTATEQPHCSVAAAAERTPSFTLDWQESDEEEEEKKKNHHHHKISNSRKLSSASTTNSIDPHQLSPTMSSMVNNEAEYDEPSEAIRYMSSSSQQVLSDAVQDAVAASPDLPAPTPARYTTSLQLQQTHQYHYHSITPAIEQQRQVGSTPRSLPVFDVFAALNASRPPDAPPPLTYMRPYEHRQSYYMQPPAPSQLTDTPGQAASSSSSLREQHQAFGLHPSAALDTNGNSASESNAPAYFPALPTLNPWSHAPSTSRQLPPLIFGAEVMPPASAAPSLFYPTPLRSLRQPVHCDLEVLQDASLYDGASTSSSAAAAPPATTTARDVADSSASFIARVPAVSTPAGSDGRQLRNDVKESLATKPNNKSLYRPAKRRKKYDEVERTYFCDYTGCSKSYGTLGHLNHHRDMSRHGPRIRQIELDRKAKEEADSTEAEAHRSAAAGALQTSQSDSLNTPERELSPLSDGPEETETEQRSAQQVNASASLMSPGLWIPSSVALAQYNK